MTDIDTLRFRANVLQKLRNFFSDHGYTELDTPSLSPALIPDASHEVFKTAYVDPWTDEDKTVFLVPSHEYFLKKAVAATKTAVFQLSKCFINSEAAGRLHSPERTLLEAYAPGVSCADTMALTEALFSTLLPPAEKEDPFAHLRPPFQTLSLDEAFLKYAGFSLSENCQPEKLADKARQLGIAEFPDNPFDEWPIDELFQLILTQSVEPALPRERAVIIQDWPSFVPGLARTKPAAQKKNTPWKEQWTLYAGGTEIARSRSEETDPQKVKAFLENESRIQSAVARVKQNIDTGFWKTFEANSSCASLELEADRLIMMLADRKSIESVIPFPFRLKTGYY